MANYLMTRCMIIGVLLTIPAGCATLSGAPATVKTACSYDQAWTAALASVETVTLRREDKTHGVIVTEWTMTPSGHTTGVFSRDANRERARFFLNLARDRTDVTISVRQAREFFSPMGVQSQSTRWRRIPPRAEEEHRVIRHLVEHLKEKGCTILR